MKIMSPKNALGIIVFANKIPWYFCRFIRMKRRKACFKFRQQITVDVLKLLAVSTEVILTQHIVKSELLNKIKFSRARNDDFCI